MRARFQFIKPEEMEATISITMPLKEWREVMRQLPSSEHPSWRLSMLIANVLGQVEPYIAADVRDIKE